MKKPADMFDREFEWAELVRFVSYSGPEATLGVVSGRRRQGKTFLLDALCEAGNGFYFAATEATEAESLRQFGVELARHLGQATPYRFEHWAEAIEQLMSIASQTDKPWPVVLDEFPFLVKASPELPSLLQRALGPRKKRASPIRLLLCGSALSFMGGLLAGNAPLRGRASLELVVPTLDYRLAADFWQISDPKLAVLVNAVVGGTPAYAREFVLGDTPRNLDDFDSWVQRNVFNPGRPLFREARFLLAEESDLRDTALYQGVLSAIANGNHTRGGIANYLARKATDLGHALTVLEDAGMVVRDPDAFHNKRSAYRIAEPILSFYHAIMRPEWSNLERPGHESEVWNRSQSTFLTKVVGPHFEHICRRWASDHATPTTLGGQRTQIQSGTLSDSSARTMHEIDVVVKGKTENGGQEELLALGEAKWNQPMGISHALRLEHIRELLSSKNDYSTKNVRLLCFSGAGFSKELITHAKKSADQIQLIDLDRLYHGE